jgi:hypothetical protein
MSKHDALRDALGLPGWRHVLFLFAQRFGRAPASLGELRDVVAVEFGLSTEQAKRLTAAELTALLRGWRNVDILNDSERIVLESTPPDEYATAAEIARKAGFAHDVTRRYLSPRGNLRRLGFVEKHSRGQGYRALVTIQRPI